MLLYSTSAPFLQSGNGSFCVTVIKNSLFEDPKHAGTKIRYEGEKTTKTRRDKNWGLAGGLAGFGLVWLAG